MTIYLKVGVFKIPLKMMKASGWNVSKSCFPLTWSIENPLLPSFRSQLSIAVFMNTLQYIRPCQLSITYFGLHFWTTCSVVGRHQPSLSIGQQHPRIKGCGQNGIWTHQTGRQTDRLTEEGRYMPLPVPSHHRPVTAPLLGGTKRRWGGVGQAHSLLGHAQLPPWTVWRVAPAEGCQ